MNRRGFLELLGAGIAGIALDEAIPLGRVWSFPKQVVLAAPRGLVKDFGSYQTFANPFGLGSVERSGLAGVIGTCQGFEWDEVVNLTTHTVIP